MNAQRECIDCFTARIDFLLQNAVEDPEKRKRIGSILQDWMRSFSFEKPPPVSARDMYRLFSRVSGVDDLYRNERVYATSYLLERVPEIRQGLEESRHPFETALKLSLAGNSIDLAIHEKVDHAGVTRIASQLSLSSKMVGNLYSRIEASKTILVIGDNAGETVLDRLLIEHFPPHDARIFYAVRSYPILNDAVAGDAVAAGIDRVATIVGTGSDIPGIIPDECSGEFRSIFERADLILSKGQGNFETLYPCHRPGLFFLFLVKCPIVEKAVNKEIGSPVVLEALQNVGELDR
jgi:hypothetical protein